MLGSGCHLSSAEKSCTIRALHICHMFHIAMEVYTYKNFMIASSLPSQLPPKKIKNKIPVQTKTNISISYIAFFHCNLYDFMSHFILGVLNQYLQQKTTTTKEETKTTTTTTTTLLSLIVYPLSALARNPLDSLDVFFFFSPCYFLLGTNHFILFHIR